VISKQALVDGIIFAGERAAAAARYCKDWDDQLAHQWTSGDAFRHLAATAGGAEGFYPLIGAGVLDKLPAERIAQSNDRAIGELKGKSKEEVARAIVEGHRASAAFVATLDEAELGETVTLGGYEMPRAELVAQIWIHHAIAHGYEASARWPIQ
jgi:hypothetical protein